MWRQVGAFLGFLWGILIECFKDAGRKEEQAREAAAKKAAEKTVEGAARETGALTEDELRKEADTWTRR